VQATLSLSAVLVVQATLSLSAVLVGPEYWPKTHVKEYAGTRNTENSHCVGI
jgi:hypothetical protein